MIGDSTCGTSNRACPVGTTRLLRRTSLGLVVGLSLLVSLTSTAEGASPQLSTATESALATSWVAQEATFEPAAIQCPSRAECYAAGTEGPSDSVTANDGIVATSRGLTSTWRIQPLPAGTAPLSLLACPSRRVCFAAPGGNAPAIGPMLPRVVVTADAGVVWRAWALPEAASADPVDLTGLSCPSVSRCIVVGHGVSAGAPYVAVTTDGGRSWVVPTFAASTPPPAGVSCLTVTRCLIVGTSIGNARGIESALTTVDGGLTWKTARLPQTQVTIGGISCSSPSWCVVVGLSTIGLPSALVTTDGARTWSTEALPVALVVPGSLNCDERGCLVGSQAVVGSPSWFRLVGPSGRWRRVAPVPSRYPTTAYECLGSTGCEAGNATGLFTSRDDGKNWSGPTQTAYPSTMDTSPSAVACSARVCSVLTVFSGPGVPREYPLVYSSVDAGRSWKRSALAGGMDGASAIACASRTHCMVLGSDAFSTIDGGASWTPNPLPRTSRPSAGAIESALSCPTAVDCVALGVGSGIARTTDDGRTWRNALVHAPMATFVDGVDCPNMVRCWAVGGSGSATVSEPAVILGSTNGGATWFPQGVPAGVQTLTAVSCPTVRRCVAVGVSPGDALYPAPDNVIVTTTDGGATWVRRAAPLGIGGLSAISCPTASFCVAVGSSVEDSFDDFTGVALVSKDGGVTWKSEAMPSGTPILDSVACSSGGNCVAVGPNTILTTGFPSVA
jgi:photosystem II stability/assembly factor-like uncharacterized protein